MINKKDITGIILAGGKSSRMKIDKGFISLGEKLFIEHVIDALSPLVNNIILVTNDTNYDEFGLKRVNDLIADQGPIGGLQTGLHYSKTNYNLVLSCDVPLITTDILQLIVNETTNEFDVTQIESKGKTMPLIAMYHKRCLTTCAELLTKGEKRLRAAVKQFKTKTISINNQLDQYVKNINTVEQLIEVRNGIEH